MKKLTLSLTLFSIFILAMAQELKIIFADRMVLPRKVITKNTRHPIPAFMCLSRMGYGNHKPGWACIGGTLPIPFGSKRI